MPDTELPGIQIDTLNSASVALHDEVVEEAERIAQSGDADPQTVLYEVWLLLTGDLALNGWGPTELAKDALMHAAAQSAAARLH